MNRAVLVGINTFQSINGLNGCINDVDNIRNILKTYFGYDNSGIHVLTDSRATTSAIVDRFSDMLSNSVAGDKCVFALSSHGSQIRDRHGDELKDGLDELVCPYDMDWDREKYITDDKLAEIIKLKPDGVELEILIDTCHSGTGTREIGLGLVTGVFTTELQYAPRARYCPPPFDIAMRSEGDEIKTYKIFDCIKEIISKSIEGNKLIVKIDYSFWGACRDKQTSADAYINGSYNGAFTYYFCKHIRDADGKISRAELLKRVRASLKFNKFDQVPQMETNKAHYYNGVFCNEPMTKEELCR